MAKNPVLKLKSAPKVRTRTVKELGTAWPAAAKVLIDHYLATAEGKEVLSFAVQAMPRSVNHQYIPGKTWEGKRNFRLHPDTRVFREATCYALGHKKISWKPTGAVAVMIFLESPEWLKQDLTIRAMDVDNFIKPVFDALKEATLVPDEINWQVHTFKIQSRRSRTIVYAFDLGDIVEVYG